MIWLLLIPIAFIYGCIGGYIAGLKNLNEFTYVLMWIFFWPIMGPRFDSVTPKTKEMWSIDAVHPIFRRVIKFHLNPDEMVKLYKELQTAGYDDKDIELTKE